MSSPGPSVESSNGKWRGVVTLGASLVPVLAAVAASAVLIVEYARNEAVFCSEGGGCSLVRRSAIASTFGVTLPALGLAGFLAIAATALASGRLARRAQLVLSGVAAVVGCALIVAQWRIGAFCVYCTVTDASALVAFGVALWRSRVASDPPAARLPRIGGAAAVAVFATVPLVVGAVKEARYDVPQVIRSEIERTPAGEVTVVDFVDFECPFCRMTNAIFAPLLAAHRDHVRCVRRQVPLRSHPHAHDAARAACCGETLGKGDAIADALFSAPVESLTPQGCEQIAASVGLPIDAYRACVADPKTDARIEADRAEFDAAGGHALPTIWIDRRRFIGAQPEPVLAQALDTAVARDRATH
jgi:uncharacterized membrane protein/predicted DsbA family dithiol-disulfide isomerase